jgi:hypothetical protein
VKIPSDILQGALDIVLAEMREDGFVDPKPWDVNHGRCADFAHIVEGDLLGKAEAHWVTTRIFPSHCVVRIKDKGHWLYYDAECLDGTTRLKDLPAWTNRHKTREEVLTP